MAGVALEVVEMQMVFDNFALGMIGMERVGNELEMVMTVMEMTEEVWEVFDYTVDVGIADVNTEVVVFAVVAEVGSSCAVFAVTILLAVVLDGIVGAEVAY